MSHTLCRSLLLAAFFLPFAGLRAQVQSPVLDLRLKQGRFEDVVDARREIVQPQLEVHEQGKAALVNSGPIQIKAKQGDPLLHRGAQTWLMRMKLQAAATTDFFPVLGQWRAAGNQRMIAFILKGGEQPALAFHMTPDGLVTSQANAILPQPPPLGEWITVVGRFTPGKEVAIFAFDDKGSELGRAKYSRMVPSSVFSAPVNLSLASAPGSGMQVSSVKIWDQALSDEQVVMQARATITAR